MQLKLSPGRAEIRDAPWAYWVSAAFVGVAAVLYGHALLTGHRDVNWHLPVWVHLALLAMLTALTVFLGSRPVLTTTFDAPARLATRRWRYLLFGGIERVAFDAVAGVASEEAVDSDSDSGKRRIWLKLRAGRRRCGTRRSTSARSGCRDRAGAHRVRVCSRQAPRLLGAFGQRVAG